jgi:hypothetical protein
MEPFTDMDQEKSWKNCVSKYCLQLHDGKIWKCPPLAYLPMQNTKYQLSDSWAPYLAYIPLDKSASREELISFLKTKSITECQMCPASQQLMHLPDPLKKIVIPMIKRQL